MDYRISNLKKALIKASLAALLAALLTGCGGSSPPAGGAAGRVSVSDLTPEFFTGTLSGEITVSAYDQMGYKNYLEEATKLFERRYPGTKINIDIFSAMPNIREMESEGTFVMIVDTQGDPQSKADYIRRVNTKIMSGAGADIYAMDIISYHKFVDSGTLENLEPYMNADPGFNRGDYRQNVLDAVRYKGGTWLIPMLYRFSYFSYDTTLVNAGAAGFGADKTWSAGGLFNIGIPLYDGTHELFNLINYDSEGEGMFVLLLNENMQSFVNAETKKAAFTDGRFSSLLESVKRYGEEGLLLQPIVGRSDATIIRNLEENRYFFKLQDEFSLEEQFRRNSGMQSMGWGLSSGMVRSINDDDEIAGIQALADSSVSFRTYNSFAMNSQSKNKALAWAFIKFLLSDEMQLSANLFGYPLNNNARSEKLEFSFSGYGNISINNDRQRQGLADYKAAVERMSDNINTFLVQDPNIKDMIASEVKYYFEGSRTANEVARVLQNKVDFYLNE